MFVRVRARCKGYDHNVFLSIYNRKQLNLHGEHLKLNILDTAGQEEYGSVPFEREFVLLLAGYLTHEPFSDSALREQWYRAGDGFLFVFSVIQRETFDELSILYEKVRRAREQERIPCVVVANKCDLRKQRTVTSAEARAFAKKLNCPFVETSAKTGVNIDVAFRQCAKSVRAIDKVSSGLVCYD